MAKFKMQKPNRLATRDLPEWAVEDLSLVREWNPYQHHRLDTVFAKPHHVRLSYIARPILI